MAEQLKPPGPVAKETVEDVIVDLARSDSAQFEAFFRRARENFPLEVTRGCLRHISEHAINSATEQMLPWLVSGNKYFEMLLDPEFLSIEAAQRAAELLRGPDFGFFLNFTQLTKERRFKNEHVPISRALSLLDGLTDYNVLYFWLRGLAGHADERIRSKAVKAMCKLRPNMMLILSHLKSTDARVRANAVEALWGLRTADAINIFRWAVSDSHHRVVVNALIGLHYSDETNETAFQKLLELATHPSEMFRAAVAWGFGYLADRRAIPVLETLASDPSNIVRERAQKGLTQMQDSFSISDESRANEVNPIDLAAKGVPAKVGLSSESPTSSSPTA
jgi:hypothetical protein